MAKNGSKGLTTWETEILATPLPTKRIVPTGGVHKPIQRFNTSTIPKCTGSIPNSITTGRKIGVKISTAGVISINVPTSNNTILITKKITNLLLNWSKRKLLISSGIPSNENNHDIAIEVHIKNITTAVVLALVSKIEEKSDRNVDVRHELESE